MDASLFLTCDDLSDEDLHLITIDLVNTLNKETELAGRLSEHAAMEGVKGEAVTIGMILLTALSSGTLVALFEVLKSYFERKNSLEVAIEHGGKKFVIRAENLKSKQMDATIKMVNDFLEN